MIRGPSPLPVEYRGFPLHPDDDTDPYVFRIDLSRSGMGTFQVVFSQEPGRGTTGVQSDLLPLQLRKQTAGRILDCGGQADSVYSRSLPRPALLRPTPGIE